MGIRIIVFLILNFAALAIGGMFTGKAVVSDWYTQLNKAPWTPPGWVFGFAWTSIMMLFSIYMAKLWPQVKDHQMLIILFAVQWCLNVVWNPVFFYYHATVWALLLISLLSVLVMYFLLSYYPVLKGYSWLILPYVVWLMIATSLNAFIVFKN